MATLESVARLTRPGIYRICSPASRSNQLRSPQLSTCWSQAQSRQRRTPQARWLHMTKGATSSRQATRSFSCSTSVRNEATSGAPDPEKLGIGLRLKPDNLFHPFSESPIPEMRQRAAFIRQQAYCPHPDHQATHVPTVAPKPEEEMHAGGEQPPAHVHFECPDCGVAVYCSKEHWMDDYESHLEICETLREINEDEHDLRSGRVFNEFRYGEPQLPEALFNFKNWDTYLYARSYDAVNEDRPMRHLTRMLTYPVTVGSVLHELSPYTIHPGQRLTNEGLKSFSALRYSLHRPKTGGTEVRDLRPSPPPMRIFILGARAESSLPREAWIELSHLFPETRLHLIFIGPESMANRDDEFPLPERTPQNPFGAIVEDRIWPHMKISTIVDYYHNIHRTGYFAPYDPYFDCFFLFHPGLGHPASSHEWSETLPMLLETKVPIIATGYTQYDLQRDFDWVNKTAAGEFDVLLEPGENIFRSLKWDLNDRDPQDITCGNWGVWSFRGKRYEATTKE